MSEWLWFEGEEGICVCCRARLPAIELVGWRFWWGRPALPAKGLLCAECEEEIGLNGNLIAEWQGQVAESPRA